jgi:hypothetical protein
VGAGALLTHVQVQGTDVSIQGDNATVEESDLSDPGGWVIDLRHASHVTIKDNDLHGSVASACDNGIRDIYGDSESLTVENNNIWGCSSGMNNIAGGGLIAQNYIHDLGFATPDAHVNGIQFEAGRGEPTTVRDNTILNPVDQTDAIILSNDGGGIETNRVITHNLLGGGGYCLYGAGGPSLAAGELTITENHFSRVYHSTCGSYGPIAYWNPAGGDLWRGNVWDDTGAPLQPGAR